MFQMLISISQNLNVQAADQQNTRAILKELSAQRSSSGYERRNQDLPMDPTQDKVLRVTTLNPR